MGSRRRQAESGGGDVGAVVEPVRWWVWASEWGRFRLATEAGRLTGLLLPAPDDAQTAQAGERPWAEGNDATVDVIVSALRIYLGGADPDFDRLPIAPAGATGFRAEVWAAMREIARGKVRTYGDLAEAIGRPGAARAVGGACAANPVPLLTPCHRVVAANRRIGGYSAAGGVEVKARLLSWEQRSAVAPDKLFAPRDLFTGQ
jgi:methylated-DNA-[protein]-cysteine S-methyltransferase